MSEKRNPVTAPALSESTRREHLIRQVTVVTLIIFVAFIGVYLISWAFFPGFPPGLILWDFAAIVWLAGCLWLVRRQYFQLTVNLYVFGVSVFLFGAMYYMRGVFGPMAIAFPALVLIAGSLGGRRLGMMIGLGNVGVYVIALFLEQSHALLPYPMPLALMPVLWIGIFMSASAVVGIVNGQVIQFAVSSIEMLGQQQRDLALATQRAQAAVEAERELRRRDTQAAEQLDRTLKQYVNFLEVVRAGDYDTRLDMNEIAKDKNLSLSLINLGRYLNATVESLVEALTEVQSVQQAYVQRSWENMAESGMTPGGYQYREDGVAVNNAVWLPTMTDAVRGRKLAVVGSELAVPLQTRGQIIGAVGARRDVTTEWSAEELEIVGAVADQLAQTIENLRLLDDTNRRAAREQAVAEVTAQIRAEVEIEAVLERALMELGRALNAERGAARLTLAPQQEEGV
jgi:hypothetical protein